MSDHTPGPWTSGPDHNPHGSAYVMARAGRFEVATVRSVGIEDCPIRNANARLIAAAPDLLDALRALHDAVGLVGQVPPGAADAVYAARRLARAAIAKAERLS